MRSQAAAAGVALIVLGLVGAAWSSAQLTYGVVEIPQHWWSSLASAPILLGAVLLALSSRTRRAP